MTIPPSPQIAEAEADRATAGAEMHRLAAELFPVLRSITGDGVRKTLARAQEIAPLEVREVPSGTRVLDWTVPDEWNVREAWVKDPAGRTVVDLRDSSLHLMSYSEPVHARLPLAELRPHLHSLPDQPDLIPYRTSYYQRAWGFCLAHRVVESLPEGEYEVFIDSTLEPGSLTYGELLLPGASDREFLISCHACHPALANDNLSGLAVTLWLARALSEVERRYSYRFLWLPGTISAITWLARNRDGAQRIAHGLVAANLGDRGGFHDKRSRRGAAEIDRAVVRVLADAGEPHAVEDFVPYGYDERQYGSPGFDLPVGSLTRTPWGRYPEYHTSADDLAFISPKALAGSLDRYREVVEVIEANRTYLNLNPYGEPQLGRHGLYGAVGGGEEGRDRQLALLWVLNLSDGRHDLLAVAERSGLAFRTVRRAADDLLAAGLLREAQAEETLEEELP
jgi:aminopeptidase-like protein